MNSLIETQKKETEESKETIRRIKTAKILHQNLLGLMTASLRYWTKTDYRKSKSTTARVRTARAINRNVLGLIMCILQHWTRAEADYRKYGTGSRDIDRR